MTSPADQQAREKAHIMAEECLVENCNHSTFRPGEFLCTCRGEIKDKILTFSAARCKELEERLEYFQKEFPQKYAHNYAEKERRIKDLEQKLAEAEQANKNMKGLEPVIRFIESQENLPHKYVEIINKHFWELF